MLSDTVHLKVVFPLAHPVACIEEEKREIEREREEIQASIEKHRELECRQQEAVIQANVALQQHQLQQMEFNQQMRAMEKMQQKRELEMAEVCGCGCYYHNNRLG